MRIDGPPPIRPTLLAVLAAAAERPGTDPGAFPIETAPLTPHVIPSTPALAQPVTSMAMLVALASIDPGIEKRRRQAIDADRGLSLLEQLRDELATGLATPAQLQALAGWVQTFEPPADPVLSAIAREIELRVRVELAKHDFTA